MYNHESCSLHVTLCTVVRRDASKPEVSRCHVLPVQDVLTLSVFAESFGLGGLGSKRRLSNTDV